MAGLPVTAALALPTTCFTFEEGWLVLVEEEERFEGGAAGAGSRAGRLRSSTIVVWVGRDGGSEGLCQELVMWNR